MRSKISTLASTAMPSDSTIPAMPDIVSTAWNEARMPIVKKRLQIRQTFAISPGMTP